MQKAGKSCWGNALWQNGSTRDTGTLYSIASRLPQWAKDAKHRTQLLKAIRRFKNI